MGQPITDGAEYGHMLRNVFLAPWFAVSLGLVIAAVMTLASPHAALTFPPGAGNPCGGAGCTGGQIVRPMLPAIGLPASDHRYINPRHSAIAVEYQLLSARRGTFMAVIIVSSRGALGSWDLSFQLPGAHIQSVMWAKWMPNGHSGIYIQGSPASWPRSDSNGARIVISGTGIPQRPRDCVLDRARCRFGRIGGVRGRRPA